MDPEVEVRPTMGQIDDLLGEINARVEKNERTFITTLTKKMAEDLTDYFKEMGIKVKYMHSDIKTLERTEIIRDLRLGVFDVLVGINLLREGIDVPEVSLVAILDADMAEDRYRIYSQEVETVDVNMAFGELWLDLSQASFASSQVAVHLDAKFGEVHIRLPHGCVMDTTGISHPLSSVKVDRFESDLEQVETRLHLSGSLFCTELEVEY